MAHIHAVHLSRQLGFLSWVGHLLRNFLSELSLFEQIGLVGLVLQNRGFVFGNRGGYRLVACWLQGLDRHMSTAHELVVSVLLLHIVLVLRVEVDHF